MIETVYVDMDGVQYDLTGAYAYMDGFSYIGRWYEHVEKSGLTVFNYMKRDFDKFIESGLFSIGKPVQDVGYLMNSLNELKAIHGFKIKLLGAYPSSDMYTNKIIDDKLEWLKRHGLHGYFDEIIFVKGSKAKELYGSFNSVLIDDFNKTESRFKKKGFPFILHRNAKDSIEKLKTILAL